MKLERVVPSLLFVVCVVAAMPFSWGADVRKALELTEPVDPAVTLRRAPPRQVLAVESDQSPVPKTGQAACWDTNGHPVDCAGTGQDGEFQKGVSASPRFTDNLNGTVTDNLTGLIWLKNANCFGLQMWPDALTASNTLASGSCGLTDGSVAGDWRLPNVKELQSLIDFGQIDPALPVGHPFSGVQSDFFYLSSSTTIGVPNGVWIVHMASGYTAEGTKFPYFNWMWPVRGGP